MKHGMNIPVIKIVVPFFLNHPSKYPIVTRFFTSLAENYPDIPVIIVDDCSTLGHGFNISIQHSENKGFTKTINDGMHKAFRDADIVIVLNDDLVISAGSLDPLLEIRGLTIASVQDTSGTNDDMFGSNFALTSEVYDLLGGYDERFKNYYSDRDYYKRAIENGVKVVKFRNIVLEHHESATFRNMPKDHLLEEDRQRF